MNPPANTKYEPKPFKKRDDGPNHSISEDCEIRIAGLEKAKTEPGMTQQDLAALDRSIAKLKEKLADINQRKAEQKAA